MKNQKSEVRSQKSAVETYLITAPEHDGFEATFEIDTAHPHLLAAMRESLTFCYGIEGAEQVADADLLAEFMKLLGPVLWLEAVQSRGNAFSVRRAFERDIEGFHPLDGAKGIKLVAVDAEWPSEFHLGKSRGGAQ